MLLEFSVSNFGCFKDEATLRLAHSTLHTLYPREGADWNSSVFPVAALLGANASGKTTFLQALAHLHYMMLNPQPAGCHIPFGFDADSADEPTSYQVDFVSAKHRYNYLIEFTQWGIQREELWEAGSRWRKLFVRTQDDETSPAHLETGPSLRGPNREMWKLVTPQTSFLALARAYGHPALAPIATTLTDIRIINHNDEERNARLQWLSRHVAEGNSSWGDIANEIARMADLGIDSVGIIENSIPPEARERLKRVMAAFNEGRDVAIPDDVLVEVQRSLAFVHQAGDGHALTLGVDAQSEGTLTWLATAGPAMEALAYGSVLLVDELDASLHPLLTRELISMFKDGEFNQHGAQLIFTTHDVSLLDNSPTSAVELGETWLTSKSSGGDSELYSMAEFRDVRSASNLQKRYLAGAFGGLPRIDRSELRSLLSAIGEKGVEQ